MVLIGLEQWCYEDGTLDIIITYSFVMLRLRCYQPPTLYFHN